MKAVRHLCLLVLLLFSGSIAAYAQAGDPVSALQELLTADKITDAARHYPVAVEDVVRSLQGDDKTEAAKILLMKGRLEGVALDLGVPRDGARGEAGNNRPTLTLLHSFISGTDAFIVTRLDFPGGRGAKRFFALHFEAGEWRLKSTGQWLEVAEEDFESDKFLQQLLPTGRNEIAAVGTLGELRNALVEYADIYRGTGYPLNLAAVSGPNIPPPPPPVVPPSLPPGTVEKPDITEDEQATDDQTDNSEEPAADPHVLKVAPEHAFMLEPAFMQDPAVKDGYVFHYKLIDPGVGRKEEAQYQITATPAQFGKTGNKSYFIDQTAVIRFTTENRDANENDEPLNEEQVVALPSFRDRRIIR